MNIFERIRKFFGKKEENVKESDNHKVNMKNEKLTGDPYFHYNIVKLILSHYNTNLSMQFQKMYELTPFDIDILTQINKTYATLRVFNNILKDYKENKIPKDGKLYYLDFEPYLLVIIATPNEGWYIDLAILQGIRKTNYKVDKFYLDNTSGYWIRIKKNGIMKIYKPDDFSRSIIMGSGNSPEQLVSLVKDLESYYINLKKTVGYLKG